MLNGKVLIEVANNIIKEIKNSSEYKENIISVAEAMNIHPIMNKVLELNELVWWEIYDYISYKIGYQDEKKHQLDLASSQVKRK